MKNAHRILVFACLSLLVSGIAHAQAAIGAPIIALDSICGHESFRCISVGPTVAQFVADPASVRSATLHDANSSVQ